MPEHCLVSVMKEGSLSQVQSLLVFFSKIRMSAAVTYLAGLLCSLPYSEILSREGPRRRMSEKSPCSVFCPRNPSNLKTSSFGTALRLDHPMVPRVASSSVRLGQQVEVSFAKNCCRKLPYGLNWWDTVIPCQSFKLLQSWPSSFRQCNWKSMSQRNVC